MPVSAAALAGAIDGAAGMAQAAYAAALSRTAGAPLAGERRLTLAGLRVRVRYVGPGWAPILDAAYGWCASTGTPQPSTGGDLAEAADGGAEGKAPDIALTLLDGEVAGAVPEALRAAVGDARRIRFPRAGGDGASAMCDAGFEAPSRSHEVWDGAAGRGLQWVARLADAPAWWAATPLRTLLGWALPAHGRILLHGAGIGRPDGALLLAARGGSGKSTSTLACLAALPRGDSPLRLAGDDCVVLETGARPPRIHALLGTAKIERAHTARFPALAPLVIRDGGPLDDPREKAVLRLALGAGPRFAPSLPLRAIVVPTLGLDRPESRVEPITRGEALLALAPTSLFFVPGSGAASFAAVAATAALLPAFRLRVGNDPSRIPLAIEALLARLAPAVPEAAPADRSSAEPAHA